MNSVKSKRAKKRPGLKGICRRSDGVVRHAVGQSLEPASGLSRASTAGPRIALCQVTLSNFINDCQSFFARSSKRARAPFSYHALGFFLFSFPLRTKSPLLRSMRTAHEPGHLATESRLHPSSGRLEIAGVKVLSRHPSVLARTRNPFDFRARVCCFLHAFICRLIESLFRCRRRFRHTDDSGGVCAE